MGRRRVRAKALGRCSSTQAPDVNGFWKFGCRARCRLVRAARGCSETEMGREYLTTEEAAVVLGLEPGALRARARRAARREGRSTVARLGGGVTAVKFGQSWRFRVVIIE